MQWRAVARSYNPLIFPHRLSGLPGDANKKVVQEVGAASKAQHSVGQLEGEVGGLAQLTGCRRGEKEKAHFNVIKKTHNHIRITISSFISNGFATPTTHIGTDSCTEKFMVPSFCFLVKCFDSCWMDCHVIHTLN